MVSYFVSEFLPFLQAFALALPSHSCLTLVELNSYQVVHLDERHQCELF